MRADARRNYDHLLAVAHQVVTEHGADASLRDIARRADVGLATLYRHFPTREALLDTLLRTTLDELATKADADGPVRETFASWLRAAVTFVQHYRGVNAVMAAALADPTSALHASCAELRAAGGRLLERAQADGFARADMDWVDLFGLIGALGWIDDQPLFTDRTDHLFDIVAGAITRT